jgi:hypothetical protein
MILAVIPAHVLVHTILAVEPADILPLHPLDWQSGPTSSWKGPPLGLGVNLLRLSAYNVARGHLGDPWCAVLQLLQILADVADAMAYLHPDIVHRDLKSQNGVQQHVPLTLSCI